MELKVLYKPLKVHNTDSNYRFSLGKKSFKLSGFLFSIELNQLVMTQFRFSVYNQIITEALMTFKVLSLREDSTPSQITLFPHPALCWDGVRGREGLDIV